MTMKTAFSLPIACLLLTALGCAQLLVDGLKHTAVSTTYGQWHTADERTGISVEIRDAKMEIREVPGEKGHFTLEVVVDAEVESEVTDYQWRAVYRSNAWEGRRINNERRTLSSRTLPGIASTEVGSNDMDIWINIDGIGSKTVPFEYLSDSTCRGRAVFTVYERGWATTAEKPKNSFYKIESKTLRYTAKWSFNTPRFYDTARRVSSYHIKKGQISDQMTIYSQDVDKYKVRSFVDKHINNGIKQLTIDVNDRNSHTALNTQMNVSINPAPTRRELVDKAFAGTDADMEVRAVAKTFIKPFIDGLYSKRGSHFELDVYTPCAVKVESINKDYHHMSGSFEVTDNTKKIVFLTDIGQVKEGVTGFEAIDVLIKGFDDGVMTKKQQDYKEAEMNAKLQAIERAGVEIISITKVINFKLKYDMVESRANAILLPGYQVMDIGYTQDGSYQVVLKGKIKVEGETNFIEDKK